MCMEEEEEEEEAEEVGEEKEGWKKRWKTGVGFEREERGRRGNEEEDFSHPESC